MVEVSHCYFLTLNIQITSDFLQKKLVRYTKKKLHSLWNLIPELYSFSFAALYFRAKSLGSAYSQKAGVTGQCLKGHRNDSAFITSGIVNLR